MIRNGVLTALPDTWTIKTGLRPDFYERFPRFSPEQMRDRILSMSFANATLLAPANIRIAAHLLQSARPYQRYAALSAGRRRALLEKVLIQQGISERTAEIVVADRERYVATLDQPLAFLDRAYVLSGDTNLSAPSLVATMLDMVADVPNPSTICEIGMGSGFHAICTAKLWPNAAVVGVEREPAMLQYARANIRHAGLAERVTVVTAAETSAVLRGSDLVYATTAVTDGQLERLMRWGRAGSTWLVPRQLAGWEFNAEPADSWLTHTYGSYDGYLAGALNRYLALDLFRLTTPAMRRIVSTLYDVRFSRYREGP